MQVLQQLWNKFTFRVHSIITYNVGGLHVLFIMQQVFF